MVSSSRLCCRVVVAAAADLVRLVYLRRRHLNESLHTGSRSSRAALRGGLDALDAIVLQDIERSHTETIVVRTGAIGIDHRLVRSTLACARALPHRVREAESRFAAEVEDVIERLPLEQTINMR